MKKNALHHISLFFCFALSTFYFLLSTISSAAAAEINFYEFAPDISTPLKISSVETPYQPLQINNEFLHGFDVWVDNIGAAGTASFSLYNDENVLLAKKTLTVPTIPQKWGGQRLHVGFNELIPVDSFSLYKIKISSSMPELRLYYSNEIQLLSFNAPFPQGQLLKSAYLGETKQDFIFKLALYESQESSPPALSNVSSTIILPDKIKIEFNANEPIDFKIDFGPETQGYTQSTNYSGEYAFCGEGLNTCSLTISASTNTAYNYRLFAKDQWENEAYVDGSFLIAGESLIATSTEPILPDNPQPPPPPDFPLGIFDARVAVLTSSSVAIAWQTNETANSGLRISSDAAGLQIVAMVNDPVFELEHLLAAQDILTPNKNYFALISSENSLGEATSSLISFATPEQSEAETPPPSPILTPIEEPSSQNNEPGWAGDDSGTTPNQPSIVVFTAIDSQSGGTTLTIQWETPSGGEPSDGYRIDIFDENSALVKQIFVESGVHEITVSGLAPGKYYMIVYANYDGIFKKIAESITNFVVPESAPGSSFLKNLVFNWTFNLTIAIALFALLTAGVIVAFWLTKKRKSKNRALPKSDSGFALIELIMTLAIILTIGLVIGNFLQFISRVGVFPSAGLENQQQLQETLQVMLPELRSMEMSNTGSYPIESASTSSLIFYSDIDKDGLVERIRYFADGNVFKKGTLKPTGDPLSYNPAQEKILISVSLIATSSLDVFSYYDENYTGSEPKMSFPINLQDIRLIKAEMGVSQGSGLGQSITTLSIQAVPRNLRQ